MNITHVNIELPRTCSMSEWIRFIKKIETIDFMAPLYVIIAYCGILADKCFRKLPSAYAELYSDLGMEICSVNRYPAYDAAVATGFLPRGAAMAIAMAAAKSTYHADLIQVVEFLTENASEIVDQLPEELRLMASDLLKRDSVCSVTSCAMKENTVTDVHWWKACFESELRADCCAPASILSFYLQYAADQQDRIFCPLGCEDYESYGKEMANSDMVLSAAIKAGMMASAIPTYINAALDNLPNWDCMSKGVRFLLEHPTLRDFVPYRERYLSEIVLHLEAQQVFDEESFLD